jgi:serine phosphatase RsbU (regulator of sigma subunit)
LAEKTARVFQYCRSSSLFFVFVVQWNVNLRMEGNSQVPQSKKQADLALIRISDVLRTSDQLNTEDKGIRNFVVPGIQVAVSAIPADMLGGDFFGIIYLERGCTAIFIGDIAGHDFSSSIIATSVLKYIEENQEDLIHPNLFLRTMNRNLYRSMSSVGRFFTIAICVIDIGTNLLSYSSAGHPPGLIDRGNGKIITIGRKAMPLGFERDLSFALSQYEFLPGDRILMYTDGVSGARNRDKEEFGQQRLEELLRGSRGDTRLAVRTILDQLSTFSADGPETDDRTIICTGRTSNTDA